jgi:hypothetical protein
LFFGKKKVKIMETNIESEHKIFYSDVNEAMALKSQHQELSVLISIENDPDEKVLFWNSFFVEPVIKNGFIVVRLNSCQHSEEIRLFSQLVPIKEIPSLFYFGPNCIGVTYSWDRYPQPKQFQSYFIPTEAPKIEVPKQQKEVEVEQEPVAGEKEKKEEPNPDTEAPQIPRTIRKARIAAQMGLETITKEFETNQKLGDLREWITSNFGPDHLIFVVHQSSYLPLDDSLTIAGAGLFPSAKLLIKDNSDEIFSNADPENPMITLNEQPQRRTAPRPTIHHNCFVGFLLKCLSIFDPWTDYEEKEDFFENKPMYKE